MNQPSSAYLTLQHDGRWNDLYRLRPDQPTLMGRSSENPIVVRTESASRRHAQIYFERGQWHVRDLDSRNGTFVNGNKISEPTSLGAALAAIAPEPQGDAASPLVDDVEGFWSAWTDTDMERVTANYVEDGTTLVILPWVPDAFQGWPAFREAAQGVINGMERFGMAPAGSPRAWQSTGAALTVGTWRADLESTDGAQTQGDARYTLLWRRCQDGWRVQHEHLSSWAAQPPNANGDPE